MKVTLLTLDVPNKNGRTYPTREIEKALDHLETAGPDCWVINGLPVHIDNGFSIPLEKISHKVEHLMIEDGKLVAEITDLDTPANRIIKELLAADVSLEYRPNGYGVVDANGFVSDYAFHSVSIVSKESAA